MCEEKADLYFEKIVLARKSHRCVECSRDIQPGEQALFVKSLYEGFWDSSYTCFDCYLLSCAIFALNPELHLSPGELYEFAIDNYYPNEFRRKDPAAAIGAHCVREPLEKWLAPRVRGKITLAKPVADFYKNRVPFDLQQSGYSSAMSQGAKTIQDFQKIAAALNRANKKTGGNTESEESEFAEEFVYWSCQLRFANSKTDDLQKVLGQRLKARGERKSSALVEAIDKLVAKSAEKGSNPYLLLSIDDGRSLKIARKLQRLRLVKLKKVTFAERQEPDEESLAIPATKSAKRA